MDIFNSAYKMGWNSRITKTNIPNPYNPLMNEDQSRMHKLFELGVKHAEEYNELLNRDLR